MNAFDQYTLLAPTILVMKWHCHLKIQFRGFFKRYALRRDQSKQLMTNLYPSLTSEVEFLSLDPFGRRKSF